MQLGGSTCGSGALDHEPGSSARGATTLELGQNSPARLIDTFAPPLTRPKSDAAQVLAARILNYEHRAIALRLGVAL